MSKKYTVTVDPDEYMLVEGPDTLPSARPGERRCITIYNNSPNEHDYELLRGALAQQNAEIEALRAKPKSTDAFAKIERALDTALDYVAGGCNRSEIRDAIAALEGIKRAVALYDEEIARMQLGLECVRQYGTDTISGAQTPEENTKAWYHDAVVQMTRRASRTLNGQPPLDTHEQ